MLVNLILNKEKAKVYNERIREIKKMHPECAEYMKEVEKLSDVFIPYSQISLGKYVPIEVDYRKDFDGVYVCDLNSNYDIERLTDYSEVKSFSPLYWRNYGVCDNASQALDYFDSLTKELEEYTKDKSFVVLLVPMIREKEPKTGGWRWHKWGPYIGKFEPKCEYLYDEKGIDFVYCFHIYEIKKDDNNTIQNATFTSVWDGGYKITTPCKINLDTKEVFDVEVSEGTADLVNELDYEFVTIDGVEHPVSNDKEETEFWYE